MSSNKKCPSCNGHMIWVDYYGFTCTSCGYSEYYEDRN